jgi:ATP-binding cassette, subfamily B, bacterial PglK
MKKKGENKSLTNLLLTIFKNISPQRRGELILILVLTIFASIAEFITIGSVIPFLGALTNPEFIFEHELFIPVVDFFQIKSSEELVLIFTSVFVMAIVMSSIVRFFLLSKMIKFGYKVGGDFSYEIYKKTLYQNYESHISRNSSEAISGIYEKADSMVNKVMMPVVTIFTSVLLVMSMLSVMIYTDPVTSLSVFLGIFLIYLTVVLVNKKKLLVLGGIIDIERSNVMKILREGLGGIRDILIDGTQREFIDMHRSADQSYRKAQIKCDMIAHTPRFVVETLAIILIVLIAYFISQSADGDKQLIPIMGMFALAGQKMLPLIQQIYSSLTSVRSAQPLLNTISLLIQKNISTKDSSDKELMPFESSIVLNDLSYNYPVGNISVLNNISLTIKKGSKVGIIGKTGSGKSTLVDIIMSLLIPRVGSIKVDNILVDRNNSQQWRNCISHVPQFIFLTDGTITDNIAFGVPKDKIDYKLVKKAAKLACIDQTIESLDGKYDSMIGERGVRLSGGQRQRIGIARALYKQANLIVLDEATSALDTKTEARVIGSFNKIKDNITMIIIAHRLSTLENCDVIIELSEGRVIKVGSYEEVVLKNEL